MTSFKIRKLLFGVAWMVICVFAATFFTVALCVYTKAKPDGAAELLSRDETWRSISELSVESGDLEAYPYVTKVYEYATDNDSVDICWVNDDSVWRDKVDHGIVEQESAKCNYSVECFVYSDIADKRLVKRVWGVSVTEDDRLTFVESKAPYFYRYSQETGDIKKGSFNKQDGNKILYYTFIRITVKPGFDKVELEVKSSNK